MAEASKAESDLRLDLAELLEQQGERTDALTLADSVQPLDNATMKRREEIALRLSVLAGDLDRARQAAERLFGLRLDTDTQVRLAGQMQQLGLQELAEAVLGRARRRAGNKATALVGLMLQYQRQGKLDVAVQVATQILRSTTATRQSNPNIYYAEDPDASRTAAVGVLARSGRLPQLIDRASEQLKKTPNSIQIHQALADYYKASSQRDKAREELAKIVALRPDDANLRYQIAQQLVQEGQAALAIDHYKIILKRDPSLVGRNFYQVQTAFQQTKKMDELMSLLEEIDLRQLGQSYYVCNLISNMFNDEKLRDRVLSLFKKAWAAFPEERSYMLQYIRGNELWQMPEMYDYARDVMIPKPATFLPGTQWSAFAQVLSYGSDGRMSSVVSQLLDLALSQGKLDELATQIEAARKEMPAWKAGTVLAALVESRFGRADRAQTLVRQFFAESKDEPLTSNVFWVIGLELENHALTRDLAVEAYEKSLKIDDDDMNNRRNFGGPAKRLVTLFSRDNRLEDARRVILEFASSDKSLNQGYNEEYVQQMKMQWLGLAADQLRQLGFTADAVPLYSQSAAIAREIGPNAPNYIGNLEMLVKKYRDGLTTALEDIKPEDLAATMTRMIKASQLADSPQKSAANVADGKGEPAKPKVKKPDQFLDLMVMVHPRELDKAAVRSLLADAVNPPSSKATDAAARADSQKGRDDLAAALESARTQNPDDLSLAIAVALLVLAGDDSVRIEPALDRLKELVDKSPLEPLAEGVRANARQRAQAARQIPLWLVARACWKRKDGVNLPGFADKLAARSRDAARRQTENSALLAMIREEGELALERGDRAAALAAWSRMLELVVEPADRKLKKPSPTPGVPAGAAPTPAISAPATGATSMAPESRRSLNALARSWEGEPPGEPRRHPARTEPRPPGITQGRLDLARRDERRFVRAGEAPSEPASRRGSPPPVRGRVQLASFQVPAEQAKTKGAAPGRPRAKAAPRSNLPILTLDRFEQAMQIARLAAEHDMADLSAKAVRDALRAGPPVVPTNPNETRRIVRARGGVVDDGPVDQASPRVVANLIELERLWQKHHVPAEAVYQALHDAVLPPSRPTEVFLYAPPLSNTALRRPQSVGSLLAAAAVRAGKVDDLKAAIAARQGQVLAELPAKVLLAQLALAGGDPKQCVAAIDALFARIKTDASRTTAELAGHAALPALDRPEPALAGAALQVLDTCVKGLETSAQPEPLGTLLLVLARRQFSLGDAPGGRKRLEAYLETMEKNTVRYSGDYPLYLRKQQLERIAAEFARAGLWADALASLARFVDAPAYSGGDPPVDDALVRLLRQIEASPVKERYQTLHDWTMPAKDRRVAQDSDFARGRRHGSRGLFSDGFRQQPLAGRRIFPIRLSREREHGFGLDRGGPPGGDTRSACPGSKCRGGAEGRPKGRERRGSVFADRAGSGQR